VETGDSNVDDFDNRKGDLPICRTGWRKRAAPEFVDTAMRKMRVPPQHCSGGYSHCVQKSTVNYDKPRDIPGDTGNVFFIDNQSVKRQMWTL
jgi:hypothetical protein